MTQDRNFHKSCQKDRDKVGENPAALRAAVFLLSAKNRRGGGGVQTPPSRAKVKYVLNGNWTPMAGAIYTRITAIFSLPGSATWLEE